MIQVSSGTYWSAPAQLLRRMMSQMLFTAALTDCCVASRRLFPVGPFPAAALEFAFFAISVSMGLLFHFGDERIKLVFGDHSYVILAQDISNAPLRHVAIIGRLEGRDNDQTRRPFSLGTVPLQ